MRFILAATIGVVLGVLLLGGCWDATPAGGAAPSDLSTYLDDLARKGQLTGSVLVARRGTTLVDRGFGLADVATDAPNRPDTQFRIGSNTKQFAALAIRLLAHEGKLAVGDPICAHLDPCPPAWAPITIQQLIDHSSGLPDYTNFPDFPQLIGTPATVEQLIARFQDLPLEFVPGTQWRYSNSGYVVLSEIIARASGQSFSDFCQARIWGPLHMARTLYDLNNPPKPSHATGYLSPGVEPVYIDMSEVDAAGAVASTVEDLALWDAALLDESLLPASDMAELFRPKIACPSGGCALPTDLGYADGWFVAQENGARYVYHWGRIDGFRSSNGFYPEQGIVVIVLSNLETVDVWGLASRLGAMALAE